MSKYYIVNEPEKNKLWLVNLDTNTVECLDKDIIGTMSAAGVEFLAAIDLYEGQSLNTETRSDASDRAYSFDGRSDASDRAYSFDGRSDASDRAYAFDARNSPSIAANPSAVN